MDTVTASVRRPRGGAEPAQPPLNPPLGVYSWYLVTVTFVFFSDPALIYNYNQNDTPTIYMVDFSMFQVPRQETCVLDQATDRILFIL